MDKYRKGDLICGQLTVMEELGRGGEGVVYLVAGARREVFAAKVIPEKKDRAALSLLQKHPARGVVRVRAVLDGDDFSVILMDYVRGETLQDMMRREILSERDCLAVGHRILCILRALRRSVPGYVCPDMKPANLMVSGKSRKLTLIDIDSLARAGPTGEAKAGLGEENRAEDMQGTPGYAAPEQFGPAPLVTEKSEIYEVAAVMAALALGKKLPTLMSERERNEALSGFSPPFRFVLEGALNDDPENRYASLGAFDRAIFLCKIRTILHIRQKKVSIRSRVARFIALGVLIAVVMAVSQRASLVIRTDRAEAAFEELSQKSSYREEDLLSLEEEENCVRRLLDRCPEDRRLIRLHIRLLRTLVHAFEDRDLRKMLIYGHRLVAALPEGEKFAADKSLTEALMTHGDENEAENSLKSLTSHYPEEPEAWLLMASWQYSLGRIREAAFSFKKASSLPGAESSPGYHSIFMKLKTAGAL